MPDWRWRRLQRRFFVESIALETIHGAYAIGAELVFAVAQGSSLQGVFFLVVLPRWRLPQDWSSPATACRL
jgi:hypothetical protein